MIYLNLSIILMCVLIAHVFILHSSLNDLREKYIRMALEVDRSKEEVRVALELNEKRNLEIYQSLSSLVTVSSFFSSLSKPSSSDLSPKPSTKETPVLSLLKEKKEED